MSSSERRVTGLPLALFGAAALTLANLSAYADPEIDAAARSFIENHAQGWLADPIVVDFIKQQNIAHDSLSQQEIDTLDQQWRNESLNARGPLIDKVLQNGLSLFLQDVKADAQGVITEVFVMDNKGLNVGQSDVTSDYWQGDESKWQKTYSVGPNAVFVDEVEMDESTQRFQTQVSVAVTDPDSGKVIGAVTIGIDAEGLLTL